MRTILAVILAFAVTLIGIGPSVSQAEIPSNYLVLKGGFYSPSKDFSLDNVHADSKTGFDGEIAFGHYFLPFLAAELGVGYFESKGNAAAQPGEAKLKVVPVLLTAKGLLPMGPVFEPYGEFGIGAYITKLDVTVADSRVTGSSKTTIGLHAGLGANFNVSESVFLGVEGRYLWAKPSFGGADIKLNGFTLTADLGFRF